MSPKEDVPLAVARFAVDGPTGLGFLSREMASVHRPTPGVSLSWEEQSHQNVTGAELGCTSTCRWHHCIEIFNLIYK